MSPESSASTAVLVVGAGPTGLTLACELARSGVSFRLVEAAAANQQGSRGKGLQPRTLEVFDDLGIVDEVLAHGRMAMPILSTGPDGQVTLGGEVPETLLDRPDIPYPASLVTPQWRTEGALRSLLERLGGRVELDTALVDLDQSDPDGVRATLRGSGSTRTIKARWVVGCDGGRSTVRRQAGIAFEGETREEVRMLVADVGVDGLDRDAWHMWRHPEGLVTLCPLPSTELFQYQASVAPGQDAGRDLANLQAVLERRSRRSDVRLHQPTWASLWRANVRLASRYREGRVLLAGDAAHVHSPAGGQGMNTGIQDAHNLAWKLAAVVAGAPKSLVDTYEAERRPVAAHVLALSDARLRQTMEQQGLPVRRDASTTQLDVGYRGSSLARDDRTPDAAPSGDVGDGLRAGDRAPDATGLRTAAGERRLFDLTRGGGWTLLDFRPRADARAGADEEVRGVRTYRVRDTAAGPGEVADPTGRLRTTFTATARTRVLIRPDGYLGLVTDDDGPAEISTYLAAVTGRAS